MLFGIVQCCGVWHACARSPALSLPLWCTCRSTLAKLLDTAVPAPPLGLLFRVVVYGGVWQEGALPLAADCVHKLLCIWVAGYGCISSRSFMFLAVDVSDTRLRRLVRLCSLPLRFACTRPCVLAYQVRFGIRLYSLYSPLTAVSRVRRCNVLRSCIHSLCGLRALTVVHWKGGGFRLSC